MAKKKRKTIEPPQYIYMVREYVDDTEFFLRVVDGDEMLEMNQEILAVYHFEAYVKVNASYNLETVEGGWTEK
jgi:hypothetical protein